jgi:hypothetical protein
MGRQEPPNRQQSSGCGSLTKQAAIMPIQVDRRGDEKNEPYGSAVNLKMRIFHTLSG